MCNRIENFCQNGGTCQEDKVGNFTTCACPARFTGPHCEIMVDNTFCDFMPCRNGGTCNINQLRNGYVCTCPQGNFSFPFLLVKEHCTNYMEMWSWWNGLKFWHVVVHVMLIKCLNRHNSEKRLVWIAMTIKRSWFVLWCTIIK